MSYKVENDKIKINNKKTTNLLLKILIIIFSILYRWSIALGSYSGYRKPKMFGDYEAQRHWMEITFNIKLSDWYVNTTENDLNYWGLDYPPLTAYHSYFMGFMANLINPEFVNLYESRGIETEDHKLFMRATVLVFDLIIFYPSVFYMVNKLFDKRFDDSNRPNYANKTDMLILNQTKNNSFIHDSNYFLTIFLILFNPTLVLVDHGHFQYNSISLGLFQISIFFALRYSNKESNYNFKIRNIFYLILCSLFYCLALNYKQMELYHALPIFFYLLGVCLKSNSFKFGFIKLIFIGLTVIFTFSMIWLPFITNGLDLFLQVLNRLFPFSRGLFEDKVANFWCSISIILKLREKFTVEKLAKFSFIVTFLFNLPCNIDLFIRPSRQRYILALVNSSLIFFLFSFQVHEKSILLATVPACLLINSYPLIVSWFIVVANFSMLPLFYKDGLVLSYLSTSVIFISVVFFFYLFNEQNRMNQFFPSLKMSDFFIFTGKNCGIIFDKVFKSMYFSSLFGLSVLSFCFLCVPAPKRLPDLWTVIICVFSCAHFIGFSFLFTLIQFTLKNNDLNYNNVKIRKDTNNPEYIFNFESSFLKNIKIGNINKKYE